MRFDIDTVRHSLSHIMADAFKSICPDCKLGIGPATDEGFYYDFYIPEGYPFSAEVLEKVTDKMKQLLKCDIRFEHNEISIAEAKKLFADEPFKLELIEDLEASGEEKVSTYRSGDFIDLCAGPHVDSTADLRNIAWRLDRIAGAYWRGNEKRPMLQRIYALAFETKDDLKDYIRRREEAAKRDHRKIGAEMELFTSSPLVGRGLPLLLPKGATIRRILERFIVDEEIARGYQHVYTPSLGRKDLYVQSGHWEHYKENMYPIMDIDGVEYVLPPMTCPHHFMIYNSKPRSYRDLPMRLAEISAQYRKEQSGELSGLLRVMCFHLADAHILCRQDQLVEEFREVVNLIEYVMRCIGITDAISYRASLRDQDKDKYYDDDKMWEQGESMLLEILDEFGVEYVIAKGEAAFYGPKLDVQMHNVMGKEETIITVQIDFCLPERFDLTYTDSGGDERRPIAIHRSSIGSIERTIAFLIEHHEGAFPLWLAPVQIRLLTITDDHVPYARQAMHRMQRAGIRVELDDRNEKIGKKLREARLQRIPYIGIIGSKEVESETIMIRNRNSGNQAAIAVQEIIEAIIKENSEHSLDLSLANQ